MQKPKSTHTASRRMTALSLLAVVFITACGGSVHGGAEMPLPSSQPPTSQPPASQPPASQPPTSQPPASQPPASQPPTSQPPASAEALENDWLARSTSSGVIFAHDFREPGEVRAFIRNATRPADAQGNDVYTVSAFGNSRALFHQIMGTTLAAPVSASTNGAVEVWQITDGSKWPVAVAGNTATYYSASVDNIERVRIVEGPWQSNGWHVRVERQYDPTVGNGGGLPAAYASGTAIATWNTEWERPLTALPAGQNGKASNDRGYGVPGNAGPGNWNASTESMHYNFRGGYWAHPDTASEYMPGGVWQSDKGPIANAYNGSEFYIQFRVRLSASKWAGADPLSRSGKMFYLQTASGSSAQQLYVPIGGGPSNYYSGPNGATSPFAIVMDGQNPGSHFETDPWGGRDLSDNSYTGRPIQPGSAYTQCLYAKAGSQCWMWPADTWVTVLLHIKPSGVNYYRRTAQLAAPLDSVDYYQADGVTRNYPTGNIRVSAGSLATWPNPAEYPYYIQIQSAGSAVTPSTSGTQYEVMKVTAIDYGSDTLTVVRNIYRSDTKLNRTHPATSSFLYGMSSGAKSYGWMDDPRLAPHKDGLIEIKVAVEPSTSYETVFYKDNIPMMYGDDSSTYGNFSENPPGFNSFRAAHYANLVYSLSGAVSGYSTAEYTQIIMSKSEIPCPKVWK